MIGQTLLKLYRSGKKPSELLQKYNRNTVYSYWKLHRKQQAIIAAMLAYMDNKMSVDCAECIMLLLELDVMNPHFTRNYMKQLKTSRKRLAAGD